LGVPLEFMSGDAAYNSYIFSKIRTDVGTYDEYLRKGLNSNSGKLLMHEFGHFLQEKYYGKYNYYSNIVPTGGSNYFMYTHNLIDYKSYTNSWTEIQANTLSYDYFGRPNYWDFKTYPIDSNLLKMIIHK